jgi:ferredoxin-NADP reductase
MTLVVTGYRAEALDIASFELRDPSGKPLPKLDPGAHLEFTLPGAADIEPGITRHYSLCNDAAETDRYVIAVGRASNVRFHFGDESGGQPPDLARELAVVEASEHVYCCGPGGLMRAVEAASGERPAGSVHFEWFAATAPAGTDDPSPQDTAFDVVLQSTGERLSVEPGKPILATLEQRGISVPFACREGLCRTCETPLCGGEADHRDYVLSLEAGR